MTQWLPQSITHCYPQAKTTRNIATNTRAMFYHRNKCFWLDLTVHDRLVRVIHRHTTSVLERGVDLSNQASIPTKQF